MRHPREAPLTTVLGHRIRLLCTNDLHAWFDPVWGIDAGWRRATGGLAALGQTLGVLRREAGVERVPTLLVDSGDAWTGSDYGAISQGAWVVEAMNALGYDAMALGNHEYDCGLDALTRRASEARFPLVAANVVDTAGEPPPGVRPVAVLQAGEVRVGVFGLAPVTTPSSTAQTHVRGFTFLDPAQSARDCARQLRDAGASVVVALSHLGVAAEAALADAEPELDVVVGGHSHSRVVAVPEDARAVVVQAGWRGEAVGVVDLVCGAGRSWTTGVRLQDATAGRGVGTCDRNAADDLGVQRLVRGLRARLRRRLARPVHVPEPALRAVLLPLDGHVH